MEYQIDMKKPYTIISYDGEKVELNGWCKTVQVSDGEFGGCQGTFIIYRDKLLTKEHKYQLRLVRSTMGPCARQRLKEKILHDIIAEHSVLGIHE